MPSQGLHDRRLLRTLPPAAALLYPGLIWSVPGFGPLFLGVALVVPCLALYVAHQTRNLASYPRSRRIAFAAVAAPPLFVLLGGLLDAQRSVFSPGILLWAGLWAVLGWIAFTERARATPVVLRRNARLAFAHGISAIVIVLFAMAHLVNQLGGLWGANRHIAIMAALRHVYRNPVVEFILLASIAFQIISGLRLLRSATLRGGDWFDTLQTASGGYLTVFFFSHLIAVMRARWLQHLDTNWIWLTASGFLTNMGGARLIPYYFLAVVALGVHGAMGIRHVLLGHQVSRRLVDPIAYMVIAAATVVSGCIVCALLRA